MVGLDDYVGVLIVAARWCGAAQWCWFSGYWSGASSFSVLVLLGICVALIDGGSSGGGEVVELTTRWWLTMLQWNRMGINKLLICDR